MEISVLIPWRTDNGERARLFEYLLPLWHATGAEICIGEDPEATRPFSVARAQNQAYRRATYDTLVMVGADMLPPSVRSWAKILGYMSTGAPWGRLYSSTGYYGPASTARIVRGRSPQREPFVRKLPYCTGPVVLTRDAYRATGGMDERMEGWGYEDSAFVHVLAHLYRRVPTGGILPTCRCLWHGIGHRDMQSPNKAIWETYPSSGLDEMTEYLAQRGRYVD